MLKYDYKTTERDMEDSKNALIPSNTEVVKNRIFGMPISTMTKYQRISFTAMIKIAFDDLLKQKDKNTFEFPAQEFFKMIGIKDDRKQSHLFTQTYVDENGWERETDEYSLEKTLKQLIGKSIDLRYKNSKGEVYEVISIALLSYFKLTKEKVIFRFDEWVRDKILTVNNAYIMKLPILASFSSTYTVALFEQLEQRRDFKQWKVDVYVLRQLFGLEEGKYERFSNFRKRVLDNAVKEINEKTNYNLRYESVKKGRKIDKIFFTWHVHKTDFEEFKSFVREKLVNQPLMEMPGSDKTMHLIQVGEDGKVYNARNPDKYYTSEIAQKIWRYLYENQDKLLNKKTIEMLEKDDEDYSKYYGKNLFFEEEMYENIILISQTKTGKLKVKFYGGELIILSKDDFFKYLLI